ncbi:MAG: hypothetical protein E6J20_08750 [Chloroflexi bacterium]|nr:MAG: hypothetical protein E6J20_08750 [Chloroflexota bacterium]
MIEHLDPLASDPLAQRLEQMEIAIPRAPHLAVLTSSPRRRPSVRAWRGASLAVGAAAVAVLTVTAAVYPGGLVGLTQDALKAAGLSQEQVAPLTGSAANAYLKVSVTGGYADQVSTVLFVSVDETCNPSAPGCGIGAPYLSDQFESRYEIIGGEGIGVGAYPIFFQPLAGAAIHGARLTLHFPNGKNELVIPLAGTLAPGRAHELALPTSIVDSKMDVTYEVKDLLYSGSYLQVHTRLGGRLQNVIVQYPPSGQMVRGESWPGVFLIDPSGHWEIPLASLRPTVTDRVQDETRIFSIAKPGTYRVVVATSGDHNAVPGSGWKVLAEWTVQVS